MNFHQILTERQCAVLSMAALTYTDAEIGAYLRLKADLVGEVFYDARQRLGTRGRVQAIEIADELGLLNTRGVVA